MNADFPRILTLLRKERGISQKQAALDLGISQALLSHYEKGIRECGLDFVVRTADFYQVSCDYLLGRSPERTGATLSLGDLPESIDKIEAENPTSIGTINKRLITNSLQILFDLLDRAGQDHLTQTVSDHLMLSVYLLFRSLYGVNPKNDPNLFTVQNNQLSTLTMARLLENQAKLIAILENNEHKKDRRIDKQALAISTETLNQDYPMFTSSLLNLIKQTEPILKDHNG